MSDYVDIYGIVYQMREQRTNMVQNEQQYICIHQCLMVVIQGLEGMGIPGRTMEMHTNRAFEGKLWTDLTNILLLGLGAALKPLDLTVCFSVLYSLINNRTSLEFLQLYLGINLSRIEEFDAESDRGSLGSIKFIYVI